MFTGIISDLGEVISVKDFDGQREFVIGTGYELSWVKVGDSIACDGACMTVTELGDGCFTVYVSAESLDKTILGQWQQGYRVNLEQALRLSDGLHGHMVSGHVDMVAEVIRVQEVGESRELEIRAGERMRYIIEKGSVTVNGVSLTVNSLTDDGFTVNIIPHTNQQTNINFLQKGSKVNLEFDLVAKYLERFANVN